jgi:hypothetical protein
VGIGRRHGARGSGKLRYSQEGWVQTSNAPRGVSLGRPDIAVEATGRQSLVSKLNAVGLSRCAAPPSLIVTEVRRSVSAPGRETPPIQTPIGPSRRRRDRSAAE